MNISIAEKQMSEPLGNTRITHPRQHNLQPSCDEAKRANRWGILHDFTHESRPCIVFSVIKVSRQSMMSASLEAVDEDNGEDDDAIDAGLPAIEQRSEDDAEDNDSDEDYIGSDSDVEIAFVTNRPVVHPVADMPGLVRLFFVDGSQTLYTDGRGPQSDMDIWSLSAQAFQPAFRCESVLEFTNMLADHVGGTMTDDKFGYIVRGTATGFRSTRQRYVNHLREREHGYSRADADLGQFADLQLILHFVYATTDFSGSVYVVLMDNNPYRFQSLVRVSEDRMFTNQQESSIAPGDVVFMRCNNSRNNSHWRLAESRPAQRRLP